MIVYLASLGEERFGGVLETYGLSSLKAEYLMFIFIVQEYFSLVYKRILVASKDKWHHMIRVIITKKRQ
ncbi:MAG: hypothetical protein PHP52_03370 [Bacteroidales bacterium]|nr:hypothetical protein [Bacteroidales bacterium]